MTIYHDKLESIFDSFIISDKSNDSWLGLSFAKRMMQDFDGDIICKSEIGKGTEFILRF